MTIFRERKLFSFLDSYTLCPQLLMRDEIDVKARDIIHVYKLDLDNSIIDVNFNRYFIFPDSPLAIFVNYKYNIKTLLDFV